MKNTIKLDKERELKYNFGSLLYIQENLDIPIEEFTTKLQEGFGLDQMPILIHAGLRKHNKDLDFEKTKELIEDIELTEMKKVFETVVTALTSEFTKEAKNVSTPTAKIPKKKKK